MVHISDGHLLTSCIPIFQDLLCNAVTCELIQRRGITKDVFRLNHPGGSIGSLLKSKLSLA